MIFLDWLLRFHPIIIILLQGPATWTPEAWLRRKLWLCLSVSVSQWLSLSWLQVPWSPGHMPQALSCLWATVMSPVHQTANTEEKCLGIPAHETISWVILQTSHWYARRPQTGNWTVLRSRSENAGCLMSDGGRLESAVTSPRSIWLSVTSSPVSSSAWAWLWADWQCSLEFLDQVETHSHLLGAINSGQWVISRIEFQYFIRK